MHYYYRQNHALIQSPQVPEVFWCFSRIVIFLVPLDNVTQMLQTETNHSKFIYILYLIYTHLFGRYNL